MQLGHERVFSLAEAENPINYCWMPGFADWRKRRGCWKTLKMFSPGARMPPPESMSRWSYHVSCLFHRHSHNSSGKFLFTIPGFLLISFDHITPHKFLYLANFFLLGEFYHDFNISSLVLYSAPEHALNFSRLFVSRSFVRISFIFIFVVLKYWQVFERKFVCDELITKCTFSHLHRIISYIVENYIFFSNREMHINNARRSGSRAFLFLLWPLEFVDRSISTKEKCGTSRTLFIHILLQF